MKQDIDQLIEKLRFWATDQNVTPDVQQARANVCEQLSTQWMDWLHVPETRGYLTLRGNLLPDLLFYEAFLQEKLIKLKIICHEEEVTESGILELPEIDRLANLKKLSIEGLGIKHIQLPYTIARLMDLIKIKITNTSISELPEPITHLFNLNTLILDHNKKLIGLPRSLARLNTLQNLSLAGCVALQSLPDSSAHPFHALETPYYTFGNLRSLKDLCLYGCQALREIPQSICEISTLKYLDIQGCTELEKLPERMDGLTSLELLKFDAKIESLPISLLRLALDKHPSFLPSPSE